jgi:hypothetical protein
MKSVTQDEPFGYLPWIVILVTVIVVLFVYVICTANI